MAKGKGWGKKKDPDPLTQANETPGQGQGPGDVDTGIIPPPVASADMEKAAQQLHDIERDMIPSCMNGCPHFFPTPEAQGKYMGLCRRYPPVPSATARYFAWPVFINHPVRGFPKYPICGEHPVFQHRKDFKPSQELQIK